MVPILKVKFEGFPLKWKFGNSHFWIQHTWNMKVSLSYHFYQKMPSHLFSRPFSQESYQSNLLSLPEYILVWRYKETFQINCRDEITCLYTYTITKALMFASFKGIQTASIWVFHYGRRRLKYMACRSKVSVQILLRVIQCRYHSFVLVHQN